MRGKALGSCLWAWPVFLFFGRTKGEGAEMSEMEPATHWFWYKSKPNKKWWREQATADLLPPLFPFSLRSLCLRFFFLVPIHVRHLVFNRLFISALKKKYWVIIDSSSINYSLLSPLFTLSRQWCVSAHISLPWKTSLSLISCYSVGE